MTLEHLIKQILMTESRGEDAANTLVKLRELRSSLEEVKRTAERSKDCQAQLIDAVPTSEAELEEMMAQTDKLGEEKRLLQLSLSCPGEETDAHQVALAVHLLPQSQLSSRLCGAVHTAAPDAPQRILSKVLSVPRLEELLSKLITRSSQVPGWIRRFGPSFGGQPRSLRFRPSEIES